MHSCLVALLTLSIAVPALSQAAPRERAPRKGGAALPAAGIKTPGIQIPFAKLKSEAEIPVPGIVPGFLGSQSIWLASKDAVVRIDPKTNKLLDPIAGLAKPCSGMVSAFQSVFVPLCDDKGVARIDPKTSKATVTLPVGAGNAWNGVAATADSVWLFTDNRVTLSRIDPADNKVVSELRLPAGCTSMVFGESSLWVTCPNENQLLRIDPRTNLVDKRITVANGPRALAIAEGSVWVLCETEGKVSRVDPKTNKVIATVDLGIPKSGGDIVAGAGSIWVTAAGFPLTRIDPTSDKVVQQFHGEGGGALGFAADSLWLINLKQASVWRIDPKRVRATLAE
jgi:streptogramin lyase